MSPLQPTAIAQKLMRYLDIVSGISLMRNGLSLPARRERASQTIAQLIWSTVIKTRTFFVVTLKLLYNHSNMQILVVQNLFLGACACDTGP